jgi:hypothetical protein
MMRFNYTKEAKFSGKAHFLPILRIIKKYPFPHPSTCSRLNDWTVGWEESRIRSFTGDLLLSYLNLNLPQKDIVCVDCDSDKHLQLHISQDAEGSVLQLSNMQAFLTTEQLKAFFKDLIRCHSMCCDAQCGSDISPIWIKNFTETERRYHKRMLLWCQYFGKEALAKWGGFAIFESNPYVQTERIHDGLLVQVGDNPDDFDTPEGEALLVNAINALPDMKQLL